MTVDDLVDKYMDIIGKHEYIDWPDELEKDLRSLVKEAASAEREECAKLVEASIVGGRAWNEEQAKHAEAANHIAKAIRARTGECNTCGGDPYVQPCPECGQEG